MTTADTFVCSGCSEKRSNEMKGAIHYTASALLEYCWECIAKKKTQPKKRKRKKARLTKEDRKFFADLKVRII